LRLLEQDVAPYVNREAEKDYRRLWGEIRRRQKALKLT